MTPIAAKCREVRRDWRNGRKYGYPICCIAIYCWDRIWNLPPAWTRCISQHVHPPEFEGCPVPCGIFHDGGAALGPAERLRRVLGYWWTALKPSASTWKRSVGDLENSRPPWVGVTSIDCEAEWKAFLSLGPLEEAFVADGSDLTHFDPADDQPVS